MKVMIRSATSLDARIINVALAVDALGSTSSSGNILGSEQDTNDLCA